MKKQWIKFKSVYALILGLFLILTACQQMSEKGTKFRVNAGGVAPMKGEMTVLIESDEQIEDWKYFEYKIKVAKDRHLRMELNVLKAGILWIDDVQIVKL